MRTVHNIAQNTPKWLQLRRQYRTASEAPAALGLSRYTTRTELLKQKATGLTDDIDASKQALFDRGHAAEAAMRSVAEELIGEDLYPITMTYTVDGLSLLASLDGATFDKSIIWEHKLWNAGLAAAITEVNEAQRVGDKNALHYLDPQYTAQLTQQLLVSGATKCLFMTSDGTADCMTFCWFTANRVEIDDLVAGWHQFETDLAVYTPKVVAEAPKAEPVMQLPALSIQIRGEVTLSNLPAFVSAADTFLSGIQTTLETDQDFANAESNIKACDNAEKGIEQTKRAITAQAVSIDEVMRTMDLYQGKLRTVRLKLTGLVKTEKEERKRAIVMDAKAAYCGHVEALQAEIHPIFIKLEQPDFAEAMRNKRTLTSIHDAVDGELARAKIAADAEAHKLRAKLAWFKANGLSFNYLFHDLQSLIQKPADDFELTVTSRIEAHKAAEAAKVEAQRQQIANEERIKAEAAANAKAAAELAAAREADAKALAEKQAQDAIAAAQATPVPAPAPAQPMVSTVAVRPMAPAVQVKPGHIGSATRVTPPTLTLGTMSNRLGFQLTAAFIASLGFEPAARVKASVLYHEHQFNDICQALIDHISSVCALQAA